MDRRPFLSRWFHIPQSCQVGSSRPRITPWLPLRLLLAGLTTDQIQHQKERFGILWWHRIFSEFKAHFFGDFCSIGRRALEIKASAILTGWSSLKILYFFRNIPDSSTFADVVMSRSPMSWNNCFSTTNGSWFLKSRTAGNASKKILEFETARSDQNCRTFFF